MSEAIPIIDVADCLAGRPGALEAFGRQVHDALTTVGFFVLAGHDVPLPLIERTFAEARRFHQLPMDKKLALKLNEHINRSEERRVGKECRYRRSPHQQEKE